MKFWTTLLAAGCVALTGATGRAADTRFSQALTASESTEAGLKRLSSDQIAVIDALVRRDLARQIAASPDTPTPTTRFSQRLTADERRTAGLTLLTEAELPRFDAFVERYASAGRTRALLGPPVFVAASPRLRPTETKTTPEIHGSFSLGMGWGSGGSSEKTGSMELHYTDPVRGFSVSVGYSEIHMKGPYIYRDPIPSPPPLVP
jgi:hypothetical protein